ncbi:MAG TPA: class I SAM-dependent methyltransferase [Thermohalobaculum sp.]|nr:class I SAM-dependent methyltransferase [Thermohalobaculum sp.]
MRAGPQPLYDTIGIDYARLCRPDPRIAAQIHAALGDAGSVLNVGAGAGSYEPADREVTAVEPSARMIAQRPPGSAPVVQAVAENLPFADKSFDAAMTVLSVHHWTDRRRGLAEMRRVARGPIVILTFDPESAYFWLADYIPALVDLDQGSMPTLGQVAAWLGPADVAAVPVPHDCTDGFLCAYWRRPEAYLDPRVRAAISSFARIGDIDAPLRRLARDIETGEWARRHAGLLALESCDCGYRLVVAD